MGKYKLNNPLPIDVQIEVLKKARVALRENKDRTDSFLCCLISRELKVLLGCSYVEYEYIHYYIPSFNLKNATRLCIKHKIKKPDSDYAWWKINYMTGHADDELLHASIKPRDKFIGVLIKELEMSCKNTNKVFNKLLITDGYKIDKS